MQHLRLFHQGTLCLVALRPEGRVLIGRGEGCDLTLYLPGLPDVAAEVRYVVGGLRVVPRSNVPVLRVDGRRVISPEGGALHLASRLTFADGVTAEVVATSDAGEKAPGASMKVPTPHGMIAAVGVGPARVAG